MTDDHPGLAFFERAERLAEEFRAGYGVQDIWTDEQIDRALADAGMPAMTTLPGEPRGMMVEEAGELHEADLTDGERRQWRRTNAMHLVAHAMLHGGQRCHGCQDWGQDNGR